MFNMIFSIYTLLQLITDSGMAHIYITAKNAKGAKMVLLCEGHEKFGAEHDDTD